MLGLLDPPAPSGPASSASGTLLLVVPFATEYRAPVQCVHDIAGQRVSRKWASKIFL